MKNPKIINFIKYFVYTFSFILLVYTLYLAFFANSQCISFFKFSFFEAIYLFLTLLNIILLIELYNFFSKSMNESEKKDKFIFEILEYVSINLLNKELLELKNIDDYRKYLLTTRSIQNRLELLKNISKPYLEKKIYEKISNLTNIFKEYCQDSSEYIQNYNNFNSKKTVFEKFFEKINSEIIEIQALILKFEI